VYDVVLAAATCEINPVEVNMKQLMMWGMLALGGLMFSTDSIAEQATCGGEQWSQFDFWVGNWQSKSIDGKLQGRNEISKILDGCALQESWTSGGGKFKGTSYNFYDAATGNWHQTWVDNSGGNLQLNGGLVEGSMVLSADSLVEGKVTVNRITWTPLADGRVRQHWEVSDDQGVHWKDVFDGYYERLNQGE
jgi:hypothetical protein